MKALTRTMKYKTRLSIFMPVLLLIFFSTSAHAYLDPGSVSLVLQSVVAAIAGAALFWKHWFYRLRGIFSMKKKDLNEENADRKDDGIKAEDE